MRGGLATDRPSPVPLGGFAVAKRDYYEVLGVAKTATEDEIKKYLMFTTDKVGETMKAAIDPKQAKDWFGANPPDLTLVARSRAGHGGTGADYLYTYLRTYYKDPTKATGWNNLVFPNVGMPHVLWELQGQQRAVFWGGSIIALGHFTMAVPSQTTLSQPKKLVVPSRNTCLPRSDRWRTMLSTPRCPFSRIATMAPI